MQSTCMQSACMHLILSYQELDNKSLIRIVQAENIDDFQKEITSIYGENSITSCVIHFMGHFIDRLTQDLKYKKFRGINLTSIDDALWESDELILDWFINTFKPFIENRINQYIDDSDEELLNQVDFKTVPWKEIKVEKFIAYENNSSRTNISTERNYEQLLKERDLPLSRSQTFKLIGAYNRDDGKYVISRAHLYAMILLYANLYVPQLEKRNNVNTDIEFSKLHLVLNSDTLTLHDIERIITNILFTNTPEFNVNIADDLKWLMYLKNDVNQSSVLKEYDHYNTITTCHIDEAFKDSMDNDSFYKQYVQPNMNSQTFIKNTFCTRSQESIVENNSNVKLINAVGKPQVFSAQNKDEGKDFVFKNTLKKTIHLSKTEIKFLKEFKKLAELDSLNSLTKTILKEFSLKSPEKIVIDELQKIQNLILDNFKFETPKSSQLEITKHYVAVHKDNVKETPATLVIADVTNYLQKHNVPLVNQNQIGIDLVDLGVKKTRKASGFVYGINLDIQNTPENTMEIQPDRLLIPSKRMFKVI